MARGRGGMRPTAPQNNPMNVSAVGGNGQNATATQAAKYVPGLSYGEGQQMMDIQQSASMAAAPGIESSGMAMAPGSAAATQPIIPLSAPSSRPNEPITAGINMGPGPDSSALRAQSNEDMIADDKYRAQIASYLPALLRIAANQNTSPTTRAIIRKLRDQV